MPDPSHAVPDRDRRRVRFPAILTIAGLGGAALAALAGLALAKSPPTLGVGHNVRVPKLNKSENIVVDSKSLTVYVLTPETTKSRLCTITSGCQGIWPPVTVGSAHAKLTAASGVKGKLGITHKFGVFQVTLDGHPLYTFAGDHKTKRNASGEGIVHFGGTWHVVRASATKQAPTHTTTTTTTTTTTMPTNPYGY